MVKESQMHKELFSWIRGKIFPEKEIPWNLKELFIDMAVEFKRLGMEEPNLSEFYTAAKESMEDEKLKHILRKQMEIGLVDYNFYRSIAQKVKCKIRNLCDSNSIHQLRVHNLSLYDVVKIKKPH